MSAEHKPGGQEYPTTERQKKGYDEAAHSGPSRYGVREGEGGVFGTSGGGTYEGGLHVEERPAVDATERGDTAGNRGNDE